MSKKRWWVVGVMLLRKGRGGTDDRLCGYLPVFDTKKAALRWAHGRAEVLAVERPERPDA